MGSLSNGIDYIHIRSGGCVQASANFGQVREAYHTLCGKIVGNQHVAFGSEKTTCDACRLAQVAREVAEDIQIAFKEGDDIPVEADVQPGDLITCTGGEDRGEQGHVVNSGWEFVNGKLRRWVDVVVYTKQFRQFAGERLPSKTRDARWWWVSHYWNSNAP